MPIQARGEQVGDHSAILNDAPVIVAGSSVRFQDLDYGRKKAVIRNILKEYHSPMVGSEEAFIRACVKYELDCYLLPSIAGLESTFGIYTWPGSNNPFGWGQGFIEFKNWDQSIDTVARGLREDYIDQGYVSVEEIGMKYCENPAWAGRIRTLMGRFQAEEDQKQLFFGADSVQL